MSELTKELASQNGNQASAMLGELTGDELLAQNGNQAGSAMGELTDDELLAQNGNQAGVGVAEYFDELDKGPKYLTFTAGGGGAKLAFFFNRVAASEEQQNPNIAFQKSTDGGLTWEDHAIGVYNLFGGGDTTDFDVITLGEGESVMFKGVNSENFIVGDPINGESVIVGFYLDGNAAASGDITSLINGVGGDAIVQFMQFYYMFYGCTDLTQAPALPATTLAEGCYNDMFSGCTSITSHDVEMLNNSSTVFYNNTSCASLTVHAETPPTIGNNTITGLKADCAIYVPAASVDAYKAAQYWSARASYIQAMS